MGKGKIKGVGIYTVEGILRERWKRTRGRRRELREEREGKREKDVEGKTYCRERRERWKRKRGRNREVREEREGKREKDGERKTYCREKRERWRKRVRVRVEGGRGSA